MKTDVKFETELIAKKREGGKKVLVEADKLVVVSPLIDDGYCQPRLYKVATERERGTYKLEFIAKQEGFRLS